MAYGDQSLYNKYLSGKDDGCGCGGGCDDCNSDSKCSCCAAGLIAVYDIEGNHVGCLTPADAQEYMTNNRTCKEGYVALYKEGVTPEFRGCVSEDSFVALNAALNPTIDA